MMSSFFKSLGIWACLSLVLGTASAAPKDYNPLIVSLVQNFEHRGAYGAVRTDRQGEARFADLFAVVDGMNAAFSQDARGRLVIKDRKLGSHCFCSSSTYAIFLQLISKLERSGSIPVNADLNRELLDIGSSEDVIYGKRDGVGLFGRWNANGPGVAVLFHELGIGKNFQDPSQALPGDFLKIFWNDEIGKKERGHLVIFLGHSPDFTKTLVWSANKQNQDGSSGNGTMWVENTRIKRAIFSRLTNPERLVNWLEVREEQRTSEYLQRILKEPGTVAEFEKQTGLR